jgi:hypothetical protein
MSATRVGWWSKSSLLVQVFVLSLLVLAGAVLVIQASERPALRMRVDLTQDQANSLDPETAELLAALPEEATLDVFLWPAPRVNAGDRGALSMQFAVRQAAAQLDELLLVASEASLGKLRLQAWDVSDLASVEGRLGELRVEVGELEDRTPIGGARRRGGLDGPAAHGAQAAAGPGADLLGRPATELLRAGFRGRVPRRGSPGRGPGPRGQ